MSILLDYVRMFEGKNDLDRRNTLIGILESKGHNFELEDYKYKGEEGINIIVTKGDGQRDILLTTHYDVVPGSPGANDNASCIAVLLDILEKLKDYKVKNRIRIIFFDDEEINCIGSQAYVAKHGVDNIIGVYNTELVGMGDTVGIWPVTKDVEGSKVLLNLKSVLEDKGYPYGEAGLLPLLFSDHRSFRECGLKDAFCLSMVDGKDMNEIRRFAESPKSMQGEIPFMFKLYHSSEDKSKYLSEEALRLMSDVIYTSIIRLDQNN